MVEIHFEVDGNKKISKHFRLLFIQIFVVLVGNYSMGPKFCLLQKYDQM